MEPTPPTNSESSGISPDFAQHLIGSQSALYAFIASLMGGVSEANDVLQETNLKLCNKANDYDPTQPFLRWAYVFARFEVMAWRKKQSRSRIVLDDDLVALIASDWDSTSSDSTQQIAALEGCLDKLPQQQRDLLDARYGRGEAVQDIAARQCRTENAMSALFYRVRKTLADCIELSLRREVYE
ncbi:sigma-70 family RNA polymerase sigma factor [Bremerella alba]|uniref:ECF RNA polymerase sigma factor SigF n=1 Tax=Bremerella alba TaxID=980252 RepID=A0A7V8V3D7_9BACT|nr:sigma-70 family RNA polymerase sigma factor [Bremerella alba]MBA2114214.1 ECF RNA polymerase sigma factor SigF [Bremerella alba]